jgi:hypothetical protein
MKSNKQSSDINYWRNKFMQVLEAMHDFEASWAKSEWARYGITEQDAALIEREFEKQLKWRAERNKVDFKG